MEVSLKPKVIDLGYYNEADESEEDKLELKVADYSDKDEDEKFIKVHMYNNELNLEIELTHKEALFLCESVISLIKNT